MTATARLAHARSVLFVPGSRPDRFHKAVDSGADLVVIDLEDAVSPADKPAARRHAVDWLEEHPSDAAVRINAAGTPEHEQDLAAVASCAPAAVLVPKAETSSDLDLVHAAFGPAVPLLPIIETAAGLVAAAAVAGTPGVVRLAFGSVDLQLDLDLPDEDVSVPTTPFMTTRFWLSVASRAAGIASPLDGVMTSLDDEDRLRLECARSRDVGFGGKLCIHPRQVEVINQSFRPTELEVERAHRILNATAATSDGVLVVDGRMVDEPVIRRARQLLRRAEAHADE